MRRIKAIGLVLVAMFAMGAVTAASASAETFPVFLEGLPPELIHEGAHLPFLALGVGSYRFRLRPPNHNVLILCKHVLMTGTLLPSGLTTGRVHFLECEVYVVDSNGTELLVTNCTVRSAGAAVGLILLNPVHDLLLFIGSKELAKELKGPVGDLFSPETGSEFVTLTFEGTGCPSPIVTGNTTVTGSVIAKVTRGVNEMNVNNSLNFTESPPTEGWRVNEKNEITTEVSIKALKIFGTLSADEIGEINEGIHLLNEQEWGVQL